MDELISSSASICGQTKTALPYDEAAYTHERTYPFGAASVCHVKEQEDTWEGLTRAQYAQDIMEDGPLEVSENVAADLTPI